MVDVEPSKRRGTTTVIKDLAKTLGLGAEDVGQLGAATWRRGGGVAVDILRQGERVINTLLQSEDSLKIY